MAKAQPCPSLQTLEHAFWAQVRRCRDAKRKGRLRSGRKPKAVPHA
jgi:hypothetical protein